MWPPALIVVAGVIDLLWCSVDRFDQVAVCVKKDQEVDALQEQQYQNALQGVQVTRCRRNNPEKRKRDADTLSKRRAVKRKQLELVCNLTCGACWLCCAFYFQQVMCWVLW